MATRNVLFEFMCEARKLTYTHALPRALIRASPLNDSSDNSRNRNNGHDDNEDEEDYTQILSSSIGPVLAEHEAECRSLSPKHCGICACPASKVLMTPMSWLHIVDNPLVSVIVTAVCAAADCEARSRRQIQDVMLTMNRPPATTATVRATASNPAVSNTVASQPESGEEDIAVESEPGSSCQVCRSAVGTKRCARCKGVAYCGKEHQSADWRRHRKVCKSTAAATVE